MHGSSAPSDVMLAERYRLRRKIATGGMSDVYEADDDVLGRTVAVKVYRSGAVEDRHRFEAEVRALGALNHPGLVHLYDAGEHDGDEFVVLELIEGPTLAAVLAERGSLAERDVRALAVELTDALAFVHAAGVVHRDVTPSNILLGADGRTRLADFGIARLLDSSRITSVEHTVGTARYMAPEQVEGATVTPAADVYSLGLVLLEALTGRAAFDGAGHEVALARLARDPDVPSGLPGPWQRLLAAMTARDPDERPSAAEVHDRARSMSGVSDDQVVRGAPGLGPAAVGAAGSVVVGSADHADADLPTSEVPAVRADARDGGTKVMPVGARAVAAPPGVTTHGATTVPRFTDAERRRLLLAAAAVLAVVLLGVAAAQDSAWDGPLPTGPADTTVVSEASTTIPPTTAPPTTEPPEDDREGSGKGKGKDKHEHDDD